MGKKSFAQHCSSELRNYAGYLERIVFCDDYKFSLSGSVNLQNCRTWGKEDPNEVRVTIQNSLSVILLCNLSNKVIIGPYFFEDEDVTRSRYKIMLRHFLVPKLRDYTEITIFQQDYAPRTMPMK